MDLTAFRIRLGVGLALALLILILATGCNQRSVAQPSRTASAQMLNAVHLTTMCPEGMSSGSGVITGPEEMWTAAHVALCDDGSHAVLIGDTWDDKPFVVLGVAYVDAEADVARLVTTPITMVGSVGIDSMVQWSEVCMESGYPNRERKCGRVQRPATWDRPGFWRTSMKAQGGNSGSGVYDEHGHLVALLTHSVGRNGEYGTLVASLSPHVELLAKGSGESLGPQLGPFPGW